MHPTSRSTWSAFAGIVLAVVAVGLDVTVLSVALPTLAEKLHASEAQLQWFSSGYALVLAAAILPAGLLGDRFGRKRVLLGSLVLFGAGSVACAASPSADLFLVSRLVLGVAGAGVTVTALSVVTVLFPEPERPRAVGVWAAAGFLSLAVGPIVGGWMLMNAWWGWIFLVNAPVSLVGIVAVLALVPGSRAQGDVHVDLGGIVASSAGLALLTYGFIRAGEDGWTDGATLLSLAGGLVVLGAFVAWEASLLRRNRALPLVDLSLFRVPQFAWGVALGALAMVAIVGILFTMPQFFQAVLEEDAAGSGFRLLPLIAGMMAGALPADRISVRLGARSVIACGFGVLAAGMLAGSTTDARSTDVFVAAWMFLAGSGAGLALATAAAGAIAELSADRSGVGSGLVQVTQKLGAPFGSAVLGSVVNATYQHSLGTVDLPPDAAAAVEKSVFGGLAVAAQLGSPELVASVRASFVAGMDDALRVASAAAIVGIVLAVAFLHGARQSDVEVDAREGATGELAAESRAR